MSYFDAIFDPETVAVVGASNALGKWGAGIFSRLLVAPNVKNVYPINKTSDKVQGVDAYPSIKDAPGEIDFVVIAIPYEGVPGVIDDCVDKGVRTILIITAGLGETGPEGAALERQVADKAAKAGIRLIGPNCMGHFNTANDLSTMRMGGAVKKGEIGVISQSGGFAMNILMSGIEAGIGFTKFVSVGNEADLHFEDFLEYFLEDEDTKLVTGYIEGLRNGRDFFRIAKKFTKEKPIVVVKVGRTEAGARAARSHTSAIAGSDEIADGMFKQSGVIRVDEIEGLFDVAAALLRSPLPKGNRVAIMTCGGGLGCVTSDACGKVGLNVAPLLPETIEKLNKVLPERWPHGNPVDTVASGMVTFPCIWPLIEDDNIDALMVICGLGPMMMGPRNWMTDVSSYPPDQRRQMEESIQTHMKMMEAMQSQQMEQMGKIVEYMEKYKKPIISVTRVPDEMKETPYYTQLVDAGIIFSPTPERASKLLAYLVEYSRYVNES
jgi:acetyltransferase